MDMATIQGAIGSLKTAGSIARSMLDIRDEALAREKVIELQSAILEAQSSALSAQSEQLLLLQQVENLQKQLAASKAWEQEKSKYRLETLSSTRGERPDNFAYVYIKDETNTEPPHKLCARCFQEGSKSILQKETRSPGVNDVLICHSCKADIYITGGWQPEHSKRK